MLNTLAHTFIHIAGFSKGASERKYKKVRKIRERAHTLSHEHSMYSHTRTQF